MKSFALIVAALLPAAFSFPLVPAISGISTRDTIEQITDTLLFANSISQFEAARNAQNPSNLDWSSDNCSYSPDNPFGFNFVPSCHRHGKSSWRLFVSLCALTYFRLWL